MRKNKKISMMIVLCLILAGTMAFNDTPVVSQILNEQPASIDTVPQKNYQHAMTLAAFDSLIYSLDQQLNATLSQLQNADLEQVRKQAVLELNNIDLNQVMKDIDHSLKAINFNSIMESITAALKEIGLNNEADLHKELSNAAVEINDAKEEINSLNVNQVKHELEAVGKEIEKASAELSRINFSAMFRDVNEQMNLAKAELIKTRQMFVEMESDGLISIKNGFRIKFEKGELFINGKRQLQQVTEKYKNYFNENHFEIEIEKEL